MGNLIPEERIERKIYLIRGRKVMLDRDLADLYQVPTKVLNQAVKRKNRRFPADFMFSLKRDEIVRMSQIVTSSGRAELKYSKSVNVFTENGVAMLSSILNSERAIMVNILIMRTFSRLRNFLATHKQLARKIGELNEKYSKHEVDIRVIFKVIKQLMKPPVVEEKPKKRIGYI